MMRPRNLHDMQQYPQLVELIIKEIDDYLPGQGREIYWRAFDKWNKAGRPNANGQTYTPLTESREFRDLSDIEFAKHLANVRKKEDEEQKSRPQREKTSIFSILGLEKLGE